MTVWVLIPYCTKSFYEFPTIRMRIPFDCLGLKTFRHLILFKQKKRTCGKNEKWLVYESPKPNKSQGWYPGVGSEEGSLVPERSREEKIVIKRENLVRITSAVNNRLTSRMEKFRVKRMVYCSCYYTGRMYTVKTPYLYPCCISNISQMFAPS